MLKTTDQWALVAQLVKNMRDNGGWAGETHIQKTLYFLQNMLNVPASYPYVLYKHSPYSFDLHDDLGNMRADLILEIKPQPHYGASFDLGKLGEVSIQRAANSLEKYERQLQFAADALATTNVGTLEQYATALFVKMKNHESDEKTRIKKIIEVKPHISEEHAMEAVRAVARLEEDARSEGLIL